METMTNSNYFAEATLKSEVDILNIWCLSLPSGRKKEKKFKGIKLRMININLVDRK